MPCKVCKKCGVMNKENLTHNCFAHIYTIIEKLQKEIVDLKKNSKMMTIR